MVQSLPPGVVAEGVDVSSVVADFVADTAYEDLDADLIERAKKSVLDLLGVTIHGTQSESAEVFLNYVRAQGGRPESTIALSEERTTAYNAALINGTFAHATELAETFTRAVVHPGNVILPGLLAVAERDSLSGKQVILGTAVGYEFLVRLGLSVGVPWVMEQGLHTPAALGAFGSTVAIAKAMDLSATEIDHSLGIVSSLSPTTLTAATKGASVKDLFEGAASAVGVMSADLARGGVTGVRGWSEQWYRAMARVSSPIALIDELGSTWRIQSGGLHFKLRAAMAQGQPVLDAVEMLIRAQTVDPERIERIEIDAPGRVSLGGAAHPTGVVGAKASARFLAAFALTHQELFLSDPHFIHSLTPETVKNSKTHDLSDRVVVIVDRDLDDGFEKRWPVEFAARVRIIFDDGERLEQYVDIWPKTANMSFDAVAEKFIRVVEGVISTARAEQIVAGVDHLDQLDDMRDLVRLIGP